MLKRAVICGVAALAIGLLSAGADGLIVNSYTPAQYDRFASGYPAAPVANPSSEFIGLGYDWSGVGWLSTISTRSYALLGPKHFLYAAHYAPSTGAPLQFAPTVGPVKTCGVASVSGSLLGDLGIGTFTAPISKADNIHPCTILFKGYSADAYVNADLFMYGRTAKVGRNTLNEVFQFQGDPATYFGVAYDTTTPGRGALETGDSGSPTFVRTGVPGEMYLVGDHYTSYSGGGADTMVSMMLSTVSNYMAQTGYLPYVATPVTATWTGADSNLWNRSANWSPKGVPADSLSGGRVMTCASVLFDGAAAAQRTLSLSATRTVTGVTFKSAPGANAFTFSSGGQLTLGEAGLTNRDDEPQTFLCPVALRASQRWDVGAGGLTVAGLIDTGAGSPGQLLVVEGAGIASFSGGVSGTGGLSKEGIAVLTLAGPNVKYTGRTTVFDGTLRLSDTTNFASDLANSATVEFAVSAGKALVLSTAIGGIGEMIKSGDGILTVSGPQAYGPGAAFDIRGGTVFMNTDAGSATAANLSIFVTDAVLQFGCNQHLDTLDIGDGARVVVGGGHIVLAKHLVMGGLDFGAMTLLPEPATLALLGLGGLGLLVRRRARRRPADPT